jgi:hypothetical protein
MGFLDVCRFLIENGADVNARDKQCEPPECYSNYAHDFSCNLLNPLVLQSKLCPPYLLYKWSTPNVPIARRKQGGCRCKEQVHTTFLSPLRACQISLTLCELQHRRNCTQIGNIIKGQRGRENRGLSSQHWRAGMTRSPALLRHFVCCHRQRDSPPPNPYSCCDLHSQGAPCGAWVLACLHTARTRFDFIPIKLRSQPCSFLFFAF